MPVVLESPLRSRERILAFGHEGTGKSSAYLSIARACPHVNFHILDNDNTMERLLDTDFADVAERGNVIYEPYVAYEWEETRESIRKMQVDMGRDDWGVIDTSGKMWDQVQEWFIQQVFGADINDYFLRVRLEKERLKENVRGGGGGKEAKSLGALEGWMDWPVINQEYHKWVSKPLLKFPGHLFVCTEAQKLNPDDDKGLRDLYGSLGARPMGQKRTGHIMQTVLFMSRSRGGAFKIETVKDRGRPVWNGEEFGGFAEEYLMGTAGWRRSYVQ